MLATDMKQETINTGHHVDRETTQAVPVEVLADTKQPSLLAIPLQSCHRLHCCFRHGEILLVDVLLNLVILQVLRVNHCLHNLSPLIIERP